MDLYADLLARMLCPDWETAGLRFCAIHCGSPPIDRCNPQILRVLADLPGLSSFSILSSMSGGRCRVGLGFHAEPG